MKNTDTVEWTSAEVKTLHDFNRKPRASTLSADATGKPTAQTIAVEAVVRLSDAVNAAVTVERRHERKYTAATSRHARGSTGAERTPWEEKNKLGEQALELATLVGDCLTSTVKALQQLRDECRVLLANVALHGASKFPADETLPKLFAGTTTVLQTLERGFLRLMPLMSSTVVLTEPLQLLNDIHRAIKREELLSATCPADDFIERWKEDTLARLRQASKSADVSDPQASAKVMATSSITDKTPLAYEMLLSPRSCLPVPPVYRPSSSAATPRQAALLVKSIDTTRKELHSKYDITSLQPKPVKLEAPSPLKISAMGKTAPPSPRRPTSTKRALKPSAPVPKEALALLAAHDSAQVPVDEPSTTAAAEAAPIPTTEASATSTAVALPAAEPSPDAVTSATPAATTESIPIASMPTTVEGAAAAPLRLTVENVTAIQAAGSPPHASPVEVLLQHSAQDDDAAATSPLSAPAPTNFTE